MLRIAICDDDPQHRRMINRIVDKALFSREDLNVQHFENGAQVVDSIKKRQFDINLLLLDIHMNPVDGMRTAEYIRRNSVDVDIIFVTVSKEHVFEGYTYKAFAYILKPIDERKLSVELNRYLDEKEKTEECLNVSMRGTTMRVPLRKILYFESDSRKIRIHLNNEEIEFYGKMDELEKVVGNNLFVRCHQSYLVNRIHISLIGRNEIMIANAVIPVSRKYQKITKELFE